MVALSMALCIHGLFFCWILPVADTVDPHLAGSTSIRIHLLGDVWEKPAVPASEPEFQIKTVSRAASPVIDHECQIPHSLPVSDKRLDVPVQKKQQQVDVGHPLRPQRRKKKIIPPLSAKSSLPAVSQVASETTTVSRDWPGHISEPGKRVQHTPRLILATPRYRENPKPVYPPLARRRAQQGTVVLTVLVAENGTVERVTLRTSSGHSLLDNAAVSTVKSWQFFPGREANRPVVTEVLVPVRFTLND